MHSVGTWWMWGGFLVFILLMLAIDLFLFGGKKIHKVSFKEALAWISIWFLCALIFNALLWWYLAGQQNEIHANQTALEFFTGYLIEQALSLDNMFAFIMVFNYFAVPMAYQRRVLLYGVLGAIVMRFIMILSGTWLVTQLQWILYLFGLFLVLTGLRMAFPSKKQVDYRKSLFTKWLFRYIRLTEALHEEKFFIQQNYLWYATPLFLALVFIEISDLVFALDSVPAIFAVTKDPFIIFTSNIFAILGLRALYFLLANMAARFYLLRYGIAVMLGFIGIKMLLAGWVDIPLLLSLGVIVTILVMTVVLDPLIRPKENK